MPSFQSREVRAIVAHFLPSELDEVKRRARSYGFWCGWTAAVPCSLAAAFPNRLTLSVAAVLAVAHMIRIPSWLWSQRRFLCLTAAKIVELSVPVTP